MPTTIVPPPPRANSKAFARRKRQTLRILRLRASGLTPAEIARQPGVIYTEQWIRSLLKRYQVQHETKGRRGG